jgi:hypothetical protein
MTTARQGGSTINVGSYIMSMGGFNAHGQPLQSVDIFDPRRSHIVQQVGSRCHSGGSREQQETSARS